MKPKRKRKYKLVFPWNSIAAQQRRQQREQMAKMQPQQNKPKRKMRKLRKEAIYVLAGVVAIALLIIIPQVRTNNKLKELGYTKDVIKDIKEQKLTKTLLKDEYYSPYLAASIKAKQVNLDYLPYYTVASQEKPLNAQSFLLISRLKDRGYDQDQILNLYKNLKFYELTPLLVFDYQFDENGYIEDCKAHPDNSPESFTLSKSYYTPYANTYPVPDPTSTGKLVNKTFYLNADYKPQSLKELSNYYAAAGVTLAESAANGLKAFGDAGRKVGVTFFATGGYRPFESQEKIYKQLVNSKGQAKADETASRPGYSELQTGLAIDIAATNEDDVKEFKDTTAFSWCSLNCQDYGWIIRYPKGKEYITQYQFQPWHFRYLGKELAQAVTASKLTFDEYYCLYLKPFEHEDCKPSDEILNANDYLKKDSIDVASSPAPSKAPEKK